jgi:hypothetical protein
MFLYLHRLNCLKKLEEKIDFCRIFHLTQYIKLIMIMITMKMLFQILWTL